MFLYGIISTSFVSKIYAKYYQILFEKISVQNKKILLRVVDFNESCGETQSEGRKWIILLFMLPAFITKQYTPG